MYDRDIANFEEIPSELKDKLFYQYLCPKLLNIFKKYFTFENIQSKKKLHFYNWKDSIYNCFMIEFLRISEPRKEDIATQIYKEDDDIQEVIFFEEGSVNIGVMQQGEYVPIMTRTKSVIIGDNECTFDQPSSFMYTVRTTCRGVFIRKRNWNLLMEKYPDIG